MTDADEVNRFVGRPTGGKPQTTARRRRKWTLIVLPFAVPIVPLSIGLAIGLSRSHSHDFGTSDVKACDLMTGRAVERATGARLLHGPSAQTAGTVQETSFGGRGSSSTYNVDVHDRDTCEYDLRTPDGRSGSVDILVVPHNATTFDPYFAAGMRRATYRSVTLVPLPHVGDQAVFGTGSAYSFFDFAVFARVGGWDIRVGGTAIAKLQTIAASEALVIAPRLKNPPNKP